MEFFSASVDGRLVDPLAPALAPVDQGFALGLAVFETVLWRDGCLYFAEEHLGRLRDGAAELGIEWPPPTDPLAALRGVAADVGERDAALRTTLSRGVPGGRPTLVVVARAVEPHPSEGVAVHLSRRGKLGGAAVERVKSTNRLRNVLAQEEAGWLGAREALLPTEEGDYSEGTYTNLFVARDGRVWTPPLERGCLAGIIRQKVLDSLAARPFVDAGGRSWSAGTGRVERADLESADEVFLTSTLGRVIPVARVLEIDRPLPGGGGPVTRCARQRLAELEEQYRRSTS